VYNSFIFSGEFYDALAETPKYALYALRFGRMGPATGGVYEK